MDSVNETRILRRAMVIAKEGSEMAGLMELNSTENEILEEALRIMGIPNLPSGGLPLPNFSQFHLHGTIHNLCVETQQLQNSQKRIVVDTGGPEPIQVNSSHQIVNGILQYSTQDEELSEEEKEFIREYAKKEIELKAIKKKERADAAKCLEDEPFLEFYFFPYEDQSGSAYSNRSGHYARPLWSERQMQIQPAEIIVAYIEIQEWKKFCKGLVPERVKESMDQQFWKKSDSQYYKEYREFMDNQERTCDWWQGYGSLQIDSIMRHFTDIPTRTNQDGTPKKDGWKWSVFYNLFEPHMMSEYKKWRTYMETYFKRQENFL